MYTSGVSKSDSIRCSAAAATDAAKARITFLNRMRAYIKTREYSFGPQKDDGAKC